MPTAEAYHDAAARFGLLAERLHREAGEYHAGPAESLMGAGPVRAAVDASLDRTASHLVAAGDELVRLSALCRVRASVCERYRWAWRRYRALPFLERTVVGPPPRPARWADP
jgi:hypothetical protein